MSTHRKKKKQVEPPIQLRYFISSLNTPFCKTLCDCLSTNLRKNELSPIIYGTLAQNPKYESNLSSHVAKTIDVKNFCIFL